MEKTTFSKFKNHRARYNFMGRSCSIAAVGSYVPTKVFTNGDLEKMVNTTDEWITTRTGIKERHLAAKDEYTSDLASVIPHWPSVRGWGSGDDSGISVSADWGHWVAMRGRVSKLRWGNS